MEIATYGRWQVCDRRVITVEGQQRMEQLFGLQRAGLVRGLEGCLYRTQGSTTSSVAEEDRERAFMAKKTTGPKVRRETSVVVSPMTW